MFERETKFIYDFNLNKIKQLGSYFSFEKIDSIGLHPSLTAYISGEIDYLIFEDRQNLLKNSAFDYSGSEILRYFDSINSEIRRNKKLSAEYVTKLLLHAVSFNVNFVVRPRWTILKFIYDKVSVMTSLEIRQIMKYVYYYDFLRDTVLEYISKKKLLSIDADEFGTLLGRIDNLLLATYRKTVIDKAINSIADFFNIGGVYKTKIPIQAVEIFLREKALDPYLKAMGERIIPDAQQKCDIKDVFRAFEGVDKLFVPAEEQEALSTGESSEDGDLLSPVVEKSFAETTSASENTEEKKIPLSDEEQTFTGEPETMEITEPDSDRSSEEKIPLKQEGEGESDRNSEMEISLETDEKKIVGEIEAEGIELETARKELDISAILKQEKINKIIEVIFDSDVEDFAYTVEKVAESADFQTAELILNEVIRKSGVKPTSKEAVGLITLFRDYFADKDNVS